MQKAMWVLTFLGLCAACPASILHDIPGGDATNLPDGVVGTINDEFGMPAGWWEGYHGWSNAGGIVATGTGDERHIEINAPWYGDSCSTWYTDYGTTSTDSAWKISADLKWTGGAGNTILFGLYGDEAGSSSSMGVSLTGTGVSWGAGSQSGSLTSATGLGNTYRTLSFIYDPTTGAASATLGSEVLFSTTAQTGLVVKRVQFGVFMPGGNYDTAALWIDNVTAAAVPEPATLAMLAIGGLATTLRRRACA